MEGRIAPRTVETRGLIGSIRAAGARGKAAKRAGNPIFRHALFRPCGGAENALAHLDARYPCGI